MKAKARTKVKKQPTTKAGRDKNRRVRQLMVAAGLARKRGPEPSVTMAVVDRVANRVGKGVPLDMALALEPNPINEETFTRALRQDVKLAAHMARGKAAFVDKFVDAIVASDDLQHMKWLVTRRHPLLFGEQLTVKNTGETRTVHEYAPEFWQQTRELAEKAEWKQPPKPRPEK